MDSQIPVAVAILAASVVALVLFLRAVLVPVQGTGERRDRHAMWGFLIGAVAVLVGGLAHSGFAVDDPVAGGALAVAILLAGAGRLFMVRQLRRSGVRSRSRRQGQQGG